MSAMPVSLGINLSIDSGYAAARLAGLNALAQIRELLGGFERLDGLLRLDGLVACSPMFTEHATVLNGASDLFVEVLGDRGWHARSAAGVNSLPMNAAVELIVTFAISDAVSLRSLWAFRNPLVDRQSFPWGTSPTLSSRLGLVVLP